MDYTGMVVPMNRYETILRDIAYRFVRGFPLTYVEELMAATAAGVVQARRYGPSLGDLQPPPPSQLPENVKGVLIRYAG